MPGLIWYSCKSPSRICKRLEKSMKLLSKWSHQFNKKDSGEDISIFGSIMRFSNNRLLRTSKKPKKFMREQLSWSLTRNLLSASYGLTTLIFASDVVISQRQGKFLGGQLVYSLNKKYLKRTLLWKNNYAKLTEQGPCTKNTVRNSPPYLNHGFNLPHSNLTYNKSEEPKIFSK